MVDQHYRSSEKGRHVFIATSFVRFFYSSMTTWLSWDQSRTGVLHKEIRNNKLSYNREKP